MTSSQEREDAKVGRHVRIPEPAIEAYIATHTVQPVERRYGQVA
ncbi:hypothetical protein [Streptomyces sp. SJL17-4]